MTKLIDLLKEAQWTSTNTSQPLKGKKSSPITKPKFANKLDITDKPAKIKKGEDIDSEYKPGGEWSSWVIDIVDGKAYVNIFDYELGNQNAYPGDKISFIKNGKTYKAVVQDKLLRKNSGGTLRHDDQYLLKIVK
jgi:hypothetical protein